MKTKVLFVDDEPNILDGLRRTLRPYRHEWDMWFAASGAEALELLAQESIHVIVSDMRMPQMDGSQLLDEVKRLYPSMVRIILSGQSEQERILRALPATHTFLSKPCDANLLREVINKSRSQVDRLRNSGVKDLVSRIEKLPSVPSVYIELLQELESGDPSIDDVAKIISNDVAMTAKILQLTNSAYFGLATHVSDPHQAAMFLGVDTILALVMSSHVFGSYDSGPHYHDVEALWRHSMACASAARRIALHQKCAANTVRHAAVAGILHDCGKLVFMVGYPDEYAKMKSEHGESLVEMLEAERDVFGAGHAEVGAHLLAIWGLPEEIVRIVTDHHMPIEQTEADFSPLHAVHAANALVHEFAGSARAEELLDQDMLLRWRSDNRLDEWRDLCRPKD